ncbi:MAG: acylphosphatase, partial [Desulfocapsaceae bacterium]|nr:acylphosphatase [Desulfocapsaceae bacterium]
MKLPACSGRTSSSLPVARPPSTTCKTMTTRNIRTLHVRIYGKVQGVFFRDHTRHTAETLGISGWVKNLRDGSVEALISGEDKQINKMLQWFHQG